MRTLLFCPRAMLPAFVLLIYVVAVTVGVFVGGLWASLGLGGALVLFLVVWWRDKSLPMPQHDFAVLALLALAVVVILNFQSSQPATSWHYWTRLVTIFLPLILLSNPSIQAHAFSPRLFPVMTVAAIVGTVALGCELHFGGAVLKYLKGPQASLTQYNRGLSYLVILSFSIMAWLWTGYAHFLSEERRLWLSALFILNLLVATGLTDSRASKLAFILGLLALVLAYYWPRVTARVLAILVLAFTSWPFVAQKFFLTHYDALKHFPNSWRARMEIWDYMSYRIMERPWLGWGLGTASSLRFQEPHGASYVFTTFPAAHAHNAFIQLWVELGVPGLMGGVALALLTLHKASTLNAKIAPFAIGSWVAALCLSLCAYDLWTDSMYAAFALTGFAFAMLQRHGDSSAEFVPTVT
jgi:exopolysaccharide production protein ExoQ